MDSAARREHFPDTTFYMNTTRIQGFQDFTCFFWCMHWILWKMTASARFTLERTQLAGGKQGSEIDHLVPNTLDSFRSPAFKKWASHIHSYISASGAQSTTPTSLALL